MSNLYMYRCSTILFLIILTNCGQYVENKSWRKESFPNPQTDITECGRNGRPSWVCDPENIISHEDGDLIDAKINMIRDFDGECPCERYCPDCGYSCQPSFAPAVAILGSVNVSVGRAMSVDHRLDATVIFSMYLLDKKWHFATCQNGLVIVWAKDDGVVWTATSTHTQENLTNVCVQQIFNENKELYMENKGTQAIINTLERYRNILEHGAECVISTTNQTTVVSGTSGDGSPPMYVFILIALAALIVVAFFIVCICLLVRRHKKKKKIKESIYGKKFKVKDLRRRLSDVTAPYPTRVVAYPVESTQGTSPFEEDDGVSYLERAWSTYRDSRDIY